MSHPKILGEVIRELGGDVTAGWDHLTHHHPAQPTSQQENTMAATLADAIHAAVTAAVSDILDRYLTLENLANATADAVNAQHAAPPPPPVASPALPPLPGPVTADAPDAPDSAGDQ